MFFNVIILTTLLSVGFHSTTSYTVPFQVLGVQQVNPIPTFEEQVALWAAHQPVDNSVHHSDEGLPFQLQQISTIADFDKEQQTIHAQSGGVDKVHEQQQHPTSTALAPAAVQASHEDSAEVEEYAGYYAPFYDDQVTVFPQMDESDSDEEQEVWPPVGIYPPPPPPPVRPTYFPPYYPPQHPVTKPPTRPTTTRPTIRPRPPTYPSLYPEYPTSRPKPPHYPQYPLEPLPQYSTTTQRPPYITTTPIYQKPGGEDVAVLENYQVISEKGIKEYKLRLSNGLTDYKKITKKHIGKKTIYVQSGYYSVPVDPTKNKFNLIHYIADERGYRVTGVQRCSNEHPCKVVNE
ncbi:uncharacterized protein LOC128858404 [Anastrepha ludens]|uniref:uncharacterized protein LOC128858404 n=1 Tax=Anastrepha ludens TaxID=28586 RepID=UPI0023AEF918|nr:uncharacterized protein LOC128858404 [Anastrepha ludens]